VRYIILAAGKGARANSEKLALPKVLLKANNGKSILINNLENCNKFNPNEIVNVIGGFMFQKIQTEIENYLLKEKNQRINLIHNLHYEQGVMTSLFAGIKNTAHEDIVILNGDTYYFDAVFQKLSEIDQSTLLVMPKRSFHDSIKVRVKDNEILFVDKNIDKYDYLSIGCLFLKKELKEKATILIKHHLMDNSHKKMIWHHIINKLVSMGEHIRYEVLNDDSAFEIDTQDDYYRFLSFDSDSFKSP
jgi:choline kinase